MRSALDGHRSVPDGYYTLHSRAGGPQMELKIAVRAATIEIMTVYPVTTSQVIRSLKTKNWEVRK